MIRNIIIAAVVVGALAGRAEAFIPGPEIIRACPGCGQEIVQPTTMSGNTFDAVFWSDGKMDAPMLPERPRLVKCPKCQAMLWINDAKELGRRKNAAMGDLLKKLEDTHTAKQRGDESEPWPNAKAYLISSAGDLLAMLKQPPSDVEKHEYLLIRAWWAVNDGERNKERHGKSTPLRQAKPILKALLPLLDEHKADDRIMKAEVYRELGDFENCLRLLDYPFDEKCGTAPAAIKSWAKQKDCRVHEVPTK